MAQESGQEHARMSPAFPIERGCPNDAELRALAALRMAVFRDWPYLYDGDPEYEGAYLSEFISDAESVLVVVRSDSQIVGAATASPLSTQPVTVQEPLAGVGMDMSATFYLGESVLLPQFRGFGLGHRMFDEREAAARERGASIAAFCAVLRPDDHPLRPSNPRELTTFWTGRGYSRLEGVTTTMEWKDIDQAGQTPHIMQFWAKQL